MVLTGALHDFDDVGENGWVDVDRFEGFLHGDDLLWRGDLFDHVLVLSSQLASSENGFLLGPVGVAHAHLHQESVHLGFWKRIGSFLLDGVLRGQHNERCREFVGDSLNGHLLLFHGFKQSCLGLGRCTVDFVSQENVREQGSSTEFELA